MLLLRGLGGVFVAERGKIRNEEYYSQLNDFSGLRWGSITPTDLDGFIDFGNKAFVFLELKHVTAGMIGGQRLAFERLCDACESAGKPSILIVGNHDTQPGEHVDVAGTLVTEFRMRRCWRAPKKTMTIKEMIDGFKEWCL